MVPAALSAMSDNAWAIKYPNLKMPELALSDRNGEVSLVCMMLYQSQLGKYALDETETIIPGCAYPLLRFL